MKKIGSIVLMVTLLHSVHAMDAVEFLKSLYFDVFATSTNLVVSSEYSWTTQERWTEKNEKFILTTDCGIRFSGHGHSIIFMPTSFKTQQKGFRIEHRNSAFRDDFRTEVQFVYVVLDDDLTEMKEDDVEIIMVGREWKTPEEYGIILRREALETELLRAFASAMSTESWETREEQNAIETRIRLTLLRERRAELEAVGMWKDRFLDDDPVSSATPPKAEPEPPPAITPKAKQSNAEEGRAVSPQPPSCLWLYVVGGALLCAVLGFLLKKTRKAG